MASNVCIIANVGIVEVGNLFLVCVQLLVERPITINPGRVFGVC